MQADHVLTTLHGKIDWTSASEIDLYNVARETSMALAEVTKNNAVESTAVLGKITVITVRGNFFYGNYGKPIFFFWSPLLN